ncbi:MAG TPA: polysaccharide deacetylase family protein [Nitrospiraceae bacterium]|jgi:peptidoglycan-N-acetylglucosamine deacetylase|nr:polysaccharide deacetylase family protein [Nitrospiraceae bacterium]
MRPGHLWLVTVMAALTLAVAADARAQVIRSGPPACPTIALTFDLCPVRKGAGYDKALIEYLIDHHIPATFFMSGKWIAKHDPEVEQLLGVAFFEVGTHGEVHAHLPMHNADEQRMEILGPVKLLSEHYAHDTVLFRPPFGEYNEVTVDVVKTLGLRLVQWNIESGDPDPSLSAEHILARIEKRAKAGSIVVLHANGKGKHTRQIVERLTADILPRKGLKPTTVSDLLSCKPVSQ